MIVLIWISLELFLIFLMIRKFELAQSLSDEDRYLARGGMVRLVVCLILLAILQVSLSHT